MKESALVTKVKEYLKEWGAYVVKYHGSQFSQIGVPDLLICYNGKFIAIELKVGLNKPTALQLKHLELIERAGGKALWANEKDYKVKLEELIKNNK